jgi:glucose-6-phosphate 1-dehydrogenase
VAGRAIRVAIRQGAGTEYLRNFYRVEATTTADVWCIRQRNTKPPDHIDTADEGVHLQFVDKTPEVGMELAAETLEFHFPTDVIRDAYERLLLDAILGDSTHFNRSDEIEFSWKIIDPFIQSWIEGDESPMQTYEKGSLGPADAKDLLGNGRKWIQGE